MFRLFKSNWLSYNGNSFIKRSFCMAKSFDKILVANRGEIACRIMDTCRKLRISSVAVYSEADVNSIHVRCADEAVCIGPASPSESYLNIPNIINAAKITGAQAIHPGYGFLSENYEFVKQIQENGISFIGPNLNAIDVMGDKIKSKKIAKEANVNVIPGYIGEITSENQLLEIAEKIGYPVMIKASAGGGGKGIRIVNNNDEAREAFLLAKNEAKLAFGDDRILIEKFIENARHIEVQLLCDNNGNSIYLNERECSIQRRNQKIIEEAPSTAITPRLRSEISSQAITLAKAVNYNSAGTVEFLLDTTNEIPQFYFLEMNTRLQVEHPVTEAITDIDIVEEMIHIASGNDLSYTQEDIPFGEKWAIECRIYAEDPSRDFLPSTGKISEYTEPSVLDNTIRIDSGVQEGSEVSQYYDPMIAKLITIKEDRLQAIDAMKSALDSFTIKGIQTNIGLLRSIMTSPRFMNGDLSLNYLAEEYPKGFKGILVDRNINQLLVLSVLIFHEEVARQLSITSNIFTDNFRPPNTFILTFNDIEYNATLNVDNNSVKLSSDTMDPITIETSHKWGSGSELLETIVDSEFTAVRVINRTYDGLELYFHGNKYKVKVQTPLQNKFDKLMPKQTIRDSNNHIISPMPGKLTKLFVKEGDTVAKDQELLVLEAMKMQNVIRSERECKIKTIHFKEGSDITVDQILIELE